MARTPNAADRPATIQDVATLAGVSMATVSRVMSGNYPVATATRAKVQKAVRELNYVANAHARALAGTTSKLVAILVSGIDSPFYAQIAVGIEQQAMAEGRLCRLGEGLDVAGSRLVLCGRPSPGPGLPVTVVEYDNESGAFALASYLLSQGHERILFLGGREDNTTIAARIAGYRRALKT